MLGLVLAVAALTTAAAPPVPGRPGELRGTVTRADGSPVRRFSVNGMKFADPAGAFKILVPPQGTFRVVVRADDLAPSVIQVQGAEGKKLVMPDIQLGGGVDVLGEVVDAESGKPVSDAFVALADPAQIDRLRFVRGERLSEIAVSGRGGWFMIPRAPRCLALLVVRHPGYLTEFVPVNTREPLPTIRLHRGGGVAGTIRDRRGTPMGGVRVVAVSEDALDAAEAVADASGRYAIRGLRPGSYRVVALTLAEAVEGPGALVADGRTVNAPIEVNRGPRIIQLPDLAVGAAPAAVRTAAAAVAAR